MIMLPPRKDDWRFSCFQILQARETDPWAFRLFFLCAELASEKVVNTMTPKGLLNLNAMAPWLPSRASCYDFKYCTGRARARELERPKELKRAGSYGWCAAVSKPLCAMSKQYLSTAECVWRVHSISFDLLLFALFFKVDRSRRETGRRWSVVLEGFYRVLGYRCKGRQEEQDPGLPSVAHGVAKISAGVVSGSRRGPQSCIS